MDKLLHPIFLILRLLKQIHRNHATNNIGKITFCVEMVHEKLKCHIK